MERKGAHVNFVHNDEIWKDHVRHETQSFSKKWPEKWGFLREEYRKMYHDLHGFTADEVVSKSSQRVKLPPVPGAKPRTPAPPSGKFPLTTAQQIGHRSTKPECQLEKYGRYAPNARGQIGILKLFNWPGQGI